MPRLVLVAGDVLLAVGEADDEAVVCAVLCQPLGFLGLSERIVNGVAVNGQTGLVLRETGTCREGIRHLPAVGLAVALIDIHLIGVASEVRTNIDVQSLLGSVRLKLLERLFRRIIQLAGVEVRREAVGLVDDEDAVHIGAAVPLFQLAHRHRNRNRDVLVALDRCGDLTAALCHAGDNALIVHRCHIGVAAAPHQIAGACLSGGRHVHGNGSRSALQNCQKLLVGLELQNVGVGCLVSAVTAVCL